MTNSNADILAWQGFLLGPLGLGGRDGALAYANLGVLVALAVGFGGTLLLERSRIRAQEGRGPTCSGSSRTRRAAGRSRVSPRSCPPSPRWCRRPLYAPVVEIVTSADLL